MPLYHYNPKKDRPTICGATKGKCPFGDANDPNLGHYRNIDEMKVYIEKRIEKEAEEDGITSVSSLEKNRVLPKGLFKDSLLEGSFTEDNFYGKQKPRSIQVPALNAVVEDLDKEDQTQLIAACGTGKTYMGRQILNHLMSKEDSNGIAVVLTSSIKLAQDTAADMRPSEKGLDDYDHAFGVYGEDYEVIEVHSSKSGGDSTVKSNGAISVEKIKNQIQSAKESGKKVIIVSTYDSSKKIQEAQEMLSSDSYQADIIMHDEAHNILGQQVVPGKSEEVLNVYTGFHNSIPGAIQSRKRLYTTATPVLRESGGDREDTGTIENAIEEAKKIKNGDRHTRITFYSDAEEIIGKVSGYISQKEAIDSGCLTKPEYHIRESEIKGDFSKFHQPVVNEKGEIVELSEQEKTGRPILTARTYSAIDSTLKSMIQDPKPGQNPTHNALVYTGSIEQSKSFRDAIKNVALHKSGGMTLDEAEKNINSPDKKVREKARLRLLSEHLDVKAAHSLQDSESKKERNEAFSMFKGNSVKDSQWTPHKRVLANVDIFSEGISINEIDTVVMADDNKLTERAMTQSIGRAIRVAPDSKFKNTGHVIIPSAVDSTGGNLHEGSIQQAVYGATRVERGISTKIVRGEPVLEDKRTSLTIYDKDGNSEKVTASSYTKTYLKDATDLLAGDLVDKTHKRLFKEDEAYRNSTPSERAEIIKSDIREKVNFYKSDSLIKEYQSVLDRIESYSPSSLNSIRKNNKVASSILSSGDINALGEDLRNSLISNKVVSLNSGSKEKEAKITDSDKKAFLENHLEAASVIAYAPPRNPKDITREHLSLKSKISEKFSSNNFMKVITSDYIRNNNPKAISELTNATRELLNDKDFRDSAYELLTNKDKRSSIPIANTIMVKGIDKTIDSDSEKMRERLRNAIYSQAEKGEISYRVDKRMVRKTGELKKDAIRKLIADF